MSPPPARRVAGRALGALVALALAAAIADAQFRGAVDVVDITATVTDGRGRFLTGLGAGDFTVREDGVPQRLIRVDTQREPVSLGLVLDASASMQGERMGAARAAIHRLLFERTDSRDELFFVEFGFNARLTQDWTSDRQLLRGALQDVEPTGDTALYDAVALAVPTAQEGRHRKKVLLVISDGRDTHSVLRVNELHDIIVASDVLVYALGFETLAASRDVGWPHTRAGADPRILRQITDATGGRTEMLQRPDQVNAAVDRIAEELGRQYHLAYERTGPRDGRRHAVKVDVKARGSRVRARSAYIAD
jgi:Ca-activated chloride channel family protein